MNSIDAVILAMTPIFRANPIRTLTEVREALLRNGRPTHRRSIRSALDRLRREGHVTVELLNARAAIYTWNLP